MSRAHALMDDLYNQQWSRSHQQGVTQPHARETAWIWTDTACCSMQPAARPADWHMICTWPHGLVLAALTDMAALIYCRII